MRRPRGVESPLVRDLGEGGPAKWTRNLGHVGERLPKWWPATASPPVMMGVEGEDCQRAANRLIGAAVVEKTMVARMVASLAQDAKNCMVLASKEVIRSLKRVRVEIDDNLRKSDEVKRREEDKNVHAVNMEITGNGNLPDSISSIIPD